MDPAEFEAPSSPDYVSGPEHPPSPDYVPGPEEPEQAPLSPDYVPEPEYPEYLVPSNVEAPIEDQPLPDDASLTTLSPGYEEHLSSVDSTALHTVNPISSAEDTEAFETDESAPTPPSPRSRRARIYVQPQTLTSAIAKALIAEYASAPTPPSPPPSPLFPLSSLLPQIPSPSLPLPSPPTTSLTYAEAPLGYKAARIRLRATLLSTHHPPEIPSLPLLLPSIAHRDDIPEADMPLRKQVGHALTSCVDYRFINTMDASIHVAESRAMTVVRCEDARDDRALLRAQVSLLIRERRYFILMASSYEREAADSRRA
ncbi:hypothetical protein Tco_1027655 [Tanacetum coccineum]